MNKFEKEALVHKAILTLKNCTEAGIILVAKYCYDGYDVDFVDMEDSASDKGKFLSIGRYSVLFRSGDNALVTMEFSDKEI